MILFLDKGLQMTDVELDARVTALEKNGKMNIVSFCLKSACKTVNFRTLCISDTIAFHTVLTSYDTIPDEIAVLFNEVLLNVGDG